MIILAVSILMGCIVWAGIRFGFGDSPGGATMTAPALEDSGEGEVRPEHAARPTRVAEATNDWERTKSTAQEVSLPDHSAATQTAVSQRSEESMRETH